MRRIFGTKRDENTGRWNKLHHDELHDFCFLPNIIRIVKCIQSFGRKTCGKHHLEYVMVNEKLD